MRKIADPVGCIITLDLEAKKEILANSRFLELWRRIAPTVDDGLLKYKITATEF